MCRVWEKAFSGCFQLARTVSANYDQEETKQSWKGSPGPSERLGELNHMASILMTMTYLPPNPPIVGIVATKVSFGSKIKNSGLRQAVRELLDD